MTYKPEIKWLQPGRCGQQGTLPWEGLLSPPGPLPGGWGCVWPECPAQGTWHSHQTDGRARHFVAQTLRRLRGEAWGVRSWSGNHGRLWGRTGSPGGVDWGGPEHEDLDCLQGGVQEAAAHFGASLPAQSPGGAEPLPVATVDPLHTYGNLGVACSVVETGIFGVSPLPLRPEIGRNSLCGGVAAYLAAADPHP